MTILNNLTFVNANGELEESKASTDTLEYLGLSTESLTGATANLSLFSGNSDVDASGNVLIGSGTAGTTRGFVSLDGTYITLNSNQLRDLAAATLGTDAVNLDQLNGALEGLSAKLAARVGTVAVLPGTMNADVLTAGTPVPAPGTRTYNKFDLTMTFASGTEPTLIDGINLLDDDRILVKDESAFSGPASGEGRQYNGIYVRTSALVWTRATDMDESSAPNEISGAYVPVQEGNDNEGIFFVQSGNFLTLDADNINFVYFNSIANLVGGSGITYTAGTGTIDVDLATDSGLQFTTDKLDLLIDGSTLVKTGGTLKVDTDGITELEIDRGAGAVTSASFLHETEGSNYLGLVTDTIDTHLIAIDDELGNLAGDIVAHAADLASNVNGDGASLVGIENANTYFTGDNVEAALDELFVIASSGAAQSYLIDAQIYKGDLLVINGTNNTVREIDISSGAGAEFGFAMAETGEPSGSVNALHDGQILTSVMTGMTPGQKVYYDSGATAGTAARFVATQPNTPGSRVWQVGTAATDQNLIIDINYVKKNAV